MEMLFSAVIAEMVNRSISFLFAKYKETRGTVLEEDLQQLLRRLLMRSDTILEEAERRHVTDPDMLQQLKALRDKTYRGYYVLDTVRCRSLPARGEGSDPATEEEEEEEEEVVNRHAFELSKFNPAKRVRPSSGDLASTVLKLKYAAADASSKESSHRMVCSLEAMIGGMDEFILLLTGCAPLYRQPYSVHLSLDRCMFGRNVEKETVMEFLLQPGPPSAGNLGVLPIVGTVRVGKSTLVENVCHDERVRNHFSLISVYTKNDLKDETAASFKDKCVTKHQNDQASEKRLLIVIELLEDVDEEAWKRLYPFERRMARGSKIIITSRSENIVRFGTTQPLRLKCLPVEADWYLFKTTAFGSDDPGHHPKLASIALEMVDMMQGSFILASIGADLLRANFNTQIWYRVLTRLKWYIQKNASLIGEHPDDVRVKDCHPRVALSVIKAKPDKYFMLHDIYQRGSGHEEMPHISFLDLLAGRAQPPGKYEILYWKSRIPPYFNYICTCEIRDI